MKKIFVLVCMVFAFEANTQDCNNYYFLQNNKMVEMTIYNKKGDADSKLVYRISDVKNAGSTVMATVQSEMFDKKGRTIAKGNSIMKCSGGIMMFNMKMNLPAPQAEQLNEVNAKAEDFYLEYPVTIKTGDHLKDGSLTMDMDNNGLRQSITMTVSDRKVEDKEKVTTSAGTWDCYKISYKSKMSLKVMGVGVPVNMDGTEWYAPGFGIIKTQSKHGATEITALK